MKRSTDRFRRQHANLIDLAKELTGHARASDLADRADEVARLLSRFAGALKLHATMEEEALYPRLLESSDRDMRTRARKLLDDVGPIYGEVGEFIRAWARADTIRGDPEAFATGLAGVLGTLGGRLKREELELYPMVDAHDDAPLG